MRICFIGPKIELQTNEGIRTVYKTLVNLASNDHEIIIIDNNKVLTKLKTIRIFNPEVIHIFIGPSSSLSFFLIKLISFLFDGRIIVNFAQPTYKSDILKNLIFNVDTIIVQSESAKQEYEGYCSKIVKIENGVDLNKFKPIMNRKIENPIRKIKILHVGHITPGRGLCDFDMLDSNEFDCTIIGSPYTKPEIKIINNLINNNINVVLEHLDNIEIKYLECDCFIFPTESKKNAIDMPLSVLEAAACNKPIVSKRFGALEDIFANVGGFIFYDNPEFLKKAIISVINQDCETRKAIQMLDWKIIYEKYQKVYKAQ